MIAKSPQNRSGPLDRFRWGKYKGLTITEVIRNDPMYVMWAVKEWLNVSPSQAEMFEAITGGEIPEVYIKRPTISSPNVTKPVNWTQRDENLYNTNRDILPNWDFDPSLAPEWWEEYKAKCKGLTRPSQRVDLYEEYVRRNLPKI